MLSALRPWLGMFSLALGLGAVPLSGAGQPVQLLTSSHALTTPPSTLPAGATSVRAVALRESAAGLGPGDQFTLELPDGSNRLATVRTRTTPRPETALLSGDFEAAPGSEFQLVYRAGVWAGDFQFSPIERYSLTATAESGPVLARLDPRRATRCGLNRTDSAAVPGPGTVVPQPPTRAAAAASGEPVIDLLVAYTPRARDLVGGLAALQVQIDLAVANTNRSLARSLIPGRVVLVGVMLADLPESPFSSDVLASFKADPTVAARRDALGADLVLGLHVATDASGVADLIRRYSVKWGAENGYCLVDYRSITTGDTVAHELGHCMGCHHDLANAGTPRVRPDALGWNFTAPDGERYRTVMAYNGISCAVFSDPALYFQGVATGVLNQANNAGTLRGTLPFAARFRPRSEPARVSLRATRDTASFQQGVDGEVLFTRTGGFPDLPLEVYVEFAGGTPEAEFQMEGLVEVLPGEYRILIPAGQSELRVRILPRGRIAGASVPPPPGPDPIRVSLVTSAAHDFLPDAEQRIAAVRILDRGPYLPPSSETRAALINVSTRLPVGTGADVGIAGFVVRGDAPTQCLIRALGPSLGPAGVPNPLADPVLELRDAAGALIATNDSWQSDTSANLVRNAGLAPGDPTESALARTLAPGAYTAIVRGAAAQTGVALIEVYHTEPGAAARPVNVSTRGLVGTGDAVMIGGFVVGGNATKRMIVRALGPTLSRFGVPGVLADPQLELRDAAGNLVAANDSWQSAQAAEIQASGLAPESAVECALIRTLAPGPYTVIVRGVGGRTGVGLVEAFDLDPN